MSTKYWKEIVTLLVIKSILLTGLWFFSFRKPIILNNKTAFEHIVKSS